MIELPTYPPWPPSTLSPPLHRIYFPFQRKLGREQLELKTHKCLHFCVNSCLLVWMRENASMLRIPECFCAWVRTWLEPCLGFLSTCLRTTTCTSETKTWIRKVNFGSCCRTKEINSALLLEVRRTLFSAFITLLWNVMFFHHSSWG